MSWKDTSGNVVRDNSNNRISLLSLLIKSEKIHLERIIS